MSQVLPHDILDANTESEVIGRSSPKARRCLRCDTRFDSAWSGERICPRCKGSSAWRNGYPLPSRAATDKR